MAASKNIKLPLSSFGFSFLCGFIKLIYQGLDVAAHKIDDNAADITALTNEIIAGEVTASLATQDGVVIETQDDVEILAFRILS